MKNVWHDPEFFASLAEAFSALPGALRAEPSDDTDRNAEPSDLVRTKRAKRERCKVDPALVARLRAGVDAARAVHAAVEREERNAAERAERRNDPVWQAEEAAREAERAAARAARAARLAREREAGAKTPALWESRDAMLNKRAKPSWRVVATHEPYPAWGRLVREYAASGELAAAQETATLAWTFERFVAYARRKLAQPKPLVASERAVLVRLLTLEPEQFATYALVARSLMDE